MFELILTDTQGVRRPHVVGSNGGAVCRGMVRHWWPPLELVAATHGRDVCSLPQVVHAPYPYVCHTFGFGGWREPMTCAEPADTYPQCPDQSQLGAVRRSFCLFTLSTTDFHCWLKQTNSIVILDVDRPPLDGCRGHKSVMLMEHEAWVCIPHDEPKASLTKVQEKIR
jgi:hypothetical protein